MKLAQFYFRFLNSFLQDTGYLASSEGYQLKFPGFCPTSWYGYGYEQLDDLSQHYPSDWDEDGEGQ